MKRLRLDKQDAKQGVASLYVVIFATILFGVITVSFTRIILSEASQSSDDDLSQSAYDAALAGVEDAKTAVNQYYDCVAKGGASCKNELFSNSDSDQDVCEDGTFPLARVLYGDEHTGEVKIQEGNSQDNDTYADQAYTCVIISDVTSDYRSTLSSDTRTRVIPLGTNSANGTQSQLGQVARVEFGWYSELNQGSSSSASSQLKLAEDKTLKNNTEKTVPPTVQLSFIKAGSTINLSDFNNADNTGNTINSTMLLLPTEAGKGTDFVSENDLKLAGNATKENPNEPFNINCQTSREFACKVQLEVGGLLNDGDNAFLVVSLPYGDAFTDFAVTLLDEKGNSVKFHGAQISVDSTGRTNQLFRRVETRLDPSDLFFPYPQFELELSGEGGSETQKNIWATNNCWKSNITVEDGKKKFAAETCDNNGTLNLSE